MTSGSSVFLGLLVAGVIFLQSGGHVSADQFVTDKCEFNISIEGGSRGQLEIGLFGQVVPYTVANFKYLADNLLYDGTKFEKVIPGELTRAGDVTRTEIQIKVFGKYVKNMDPENFLLKHYGAGWLSMNKGQTSGQVSGFKFTITFSKTPKLDGKQVVFAKILKGMSFLREIEKVPTDPDILWPLKPVVIKEVTCESLKTPIATAEADATD